MKCFWLFSHKYTKWEITDEGTIKAQSPFGGEERVVAKVYEQKRRCKDCGRLQTRLQQTKI